MQLDDQEIKIALEIIGFADEQIYKSDFLNLAKRETGKVLYEIRLRIFNHLVEQKFIYLDAHDRLRRNDIDDNVYVKEALRKNDSQMFKLLELIEPESEVFRLFDSTFAKELGTKGELFVIDQLVNVFGIKREQINHIAQRDDTVGYDIFSPSTANFERKMMLEVKTSCRSNWPFHFYVSRNEIMTGKRYKNWRLVFVSAVDNEFNILGNIGFEDLVDLLPLDRANLGYWETAKLIMQPNWIDEGLP